MPGPCGCASRLHNLAPQAVAGEASYLDSSFVDVRHEDILKERMGVGFLVFFSCAPVGFDLIEVTVLGVADDASASQVK